MTRGDVMIDGGKLKAIRDSLMLTQSQFADKLGVSREWISGVESLGKRSVLRRKLGDVADALRMKPDELIAPAVREWDANVEPYSRVDIEHDIPFFDLPVAASDWQQVTDNQTAGIHCSREQIRQGLFRVRVRGDSMQPRFEDGCVVEFRLLCTAEGAVDFSRLKVGDAYYVQKDDGCGTFKILHEIDGETLVLMAINKRYKKPLTALMSEVVGLAKFEWKLSR